MNAGPKRFAIVHTEPYFDSVPCLYSAAQLLAEAGATVDVFTSFSDRFKHPTPSHERITFHQAFPLPRAARAGLSRFLPGRFDRRRLIQSEHRRQPFSAVIASDQNVIYAMDHLFQGYHVPFVYVSLEIEFYAEFTNAARREDKKRECELSRQCRMVLVQDEERAKLLIAANAIPKEVIRLLPNSPLGEPSGQRSNMLRDRFCLGADRLIILHAGSLGEWTGFWQLLQSASGWPEEWLLVVQARGADALQRLPVKQRIELETLIREKRAVFFPDPVASAEYPKLVQSAEIGCAFYLPEPNKLLFGDNLRYVGRSSGKAASYLLCGLPVLTNAACNLSAIVKDHSCGEVLDTPLDSKTGIERILGDYRTYSDNAVKCFDELYHFSRHFEPIMREL